MPIIGNVGRRSFKVRFLNVTIHVVLILGAVTMVYPFLIMLSGSVKSAVDSRKLTAIPSYFYDEDMLYRKWIEAKYNESVKAYAQCYRELPASFMVVQSPAKPSVQRYQDWNAFLDETDESVANLYRSLGHAYGIGIKPEMFRRFIAELKAEPDVRDDIVKLNIRYGTTFTEWDRIGSPTLTFLGREASGGLSPIMERIVAFGNAQPRGAFTYYSMDSVFVESVLRPQYADIQQLNSALGTSFRSWADVKLSRRVPEGPMREHWTYFVRQRINLRFIAVSDEALSDYQAFVKGKYEHIDLLNERYGTTYKDFSDVPLLHDVPREGIILADWDQFVTLSAKLDHLSVRTLDFMYREFLERKYGTVEALIAAHEFGLQGFDDLALTETMPLENILYAADWADFARMNIGSGWVSPDSGARRDWVNFLTKPYKVEEGVDIAALNAALGTNYADTTKIALSLKKPSQPKLAERWLEFVHDVCPANLLRVNVPDASEAWGEFIRGKYANAGEINRRYGFTPANFNDVDLPTADVDWFTFVQTKKHVFREFITRNYAVVFQMMVSNGRAIVNTLIYCFLAVVTALVVNPLAAYALSRYKPPSQYKLLLMLMLTMAFPEMVLGIPNFLLLRNLGLLNTFAALVLPGIANGYMIFILKGFFDSLPRELYESAQIDGASEWTMFWQITMATSKPILAVIGLGAFTAAYGNFMLAFIVCQDRKMWTMMVHIYQLQGGSSQSVSFASLVIAAVPTLLVFVFCQNIIMRGIVVPTEK